MKIYRGTYPRSSELYHHGILGQKWGVRRFQNPDGSLTAEGRERYGSGNSESAGQKFKTGARHVGNAIGKAAKTTGKAVGKAAVATGKYAVKKVKQRHPSLMTNEELAEYVARLSAEKKVSDMRKELRTPRLAGAGKVVGDILSSGAKTLAQAGFNKLANDMFKTQEEKELERETNTLGYKNRRLEALQKNKDLNEKLKGTNPKKNFDWAVDVLNNPNKYEADDVKTASEMWNNIDKFNKNANKGNSGTQKESNDAPAAQNTKQKSQSESPSYRMRSLDDMENDYPAGFSGSRYENRTVTTPLKYIELSNQKRAESMSNNEYRPAKVVFEEPEAKAAIAKGEDFVFTIFGEDGPVNWYYDG